MKKLIKAGATSQTIDIFIQDSTSTTGAGKTGLAYNTASLTAYYRKGATGTATAITLATQTVGGAYSSGGFVEIDGTNMPGMYRLDLPNAVVDTAGSASLMLKGATGMAPCTIELQMGTFDFEAGAVQTGDSYAIVNNGTYGNSALNTKLGSPAFTSIADDIAHVHTDTTSISGRIPAALSGGKMDSVVAAADTRSAVGLASANLDTQLGAIVGYIDTEVAAIKVKTDNLPASFPTNFASMSITAGGTVNADVVAISTDTDAVTRLERVLSGNVTGTCTTGCTTTSIATSTMSPAASVTDQFKGKILTFDAATTTAALRGQATDITASTALGVLTVTALTTAPASGDTFTLS